LCGMEPNEQAVDNMALGFMSFIRNNPKLIQEFIT